MTFSSSLRRGGCLLLALLATPAVAGNRLQLPNGSALPVAGTMDVIWVESFEPPSGRGATTSVYSLWSPVTGATARLAVPASFGVAAAARVASRWVFLGSVVQRPVAEHTPQAVLFLDAGGKAVSVTLPLQRAQSRLLVLADGSVLVVGGTSFAQAPLNAVERISFNNGHPQVEQLPDLPGVARDGYALVALHDGRALAIGGTAHGGIGCRGCVPETYVLDPATKAWTAGPPLATPRAGHTATVMADGSVLVAGGWTSGLSDHATRTTERWTPGTRRFVAAADLPIAMALQRAFNVPGMPGQLLLAGGMTDSTTANEAVAAHDEASGAWRTVGGNCHAKYKGTGVDAGPVIKDGITYLWCQPEYRKTVFLPLRLPGKHVDESDNVVLQRMQAAFLPAQDGRQALVLGGLATRAATSAVDAISLDGRVDPLITLRHPRYGARAFVAADGSTLVVGGVADDAAPAADVAVLPVEWLSSQGRLEQATWSTVATTLHADDIVGQAADRALLALAPDGAMRRIAIAVDAGKPAAIETALPALNRKRKAFQGGYVGAAPTVRGLPDGRIIVAGGAVQVDRIAVLQEDAMRAGAPDRYVGVGEYLPSRRHEIYEPGTHAWHDSAPARGAGGPVVVFDDGRVLKLTVIASRPSGRGDGRIEVPGFFEISTADGSAWAPFASQALQVRLDGEARPFLAQGELFLAGQRADIVPHASRTMLQWWNSGTRAWETLWQSDASNDGYDHPGRIVTRLLANGKRVILPTEGF